jgi:hypothetical protein
MNYYWVSLATFSLFFLFVKDKNNHSLTAFMYLAGKAKYWYAVQVSDTTMLTMVEKAGIKKI